MDRLRRIAGMGKAKAPVAVQKEKDESIVFFRELYKREKERDVNLLEPMYSVEFDAIQGGYVCKVPAGKRDFLIPVDEKHDYEWLKSTPSTPLFPSLEMEARASPTAFQKELLIPPRQVKPSSSRVSARPEATKTSARPASPTANFLSNKTFVKTSPAISKEKNQLHITDRRLSHKIQMNGQQKEAAAAVSAPRSSSATKKHSERCYASQTGNTSATKKHSERCYASQTGNSSATTKHSERCYASQTGSTKAIKGVEEQDVLFRAPKNLITNGSMLRRHPPSVDRAWTKDHGFGADAKKENGIARRQSCPPSASATRGMKEQQLDGRENPLPPRDRTLAGAIKGTRTTHGKKEQRPEVGIQAK